MALRIFIARELWEKEWFWFLPDNLKLFWFFILTHCDHAGVWSVNFGLTSSHVRKLPSSTEVLEKFDGQIIELTKKQWLIPDFVPFQYPKLSLRNNAHAPVFKALKKHGLDRYLVEGSEEQIRIFKVPIGEPIGSLYRVTQYKDKDKDKDKDKERTPRAKSESEIQEWALEIVYEWNAWRKARGLGADAATAPKGQGIKNLIKLTKGKDKYPREQLARCVTRYLEHDANSECMFGFANFWGKQRRFETFLADDWQPPAGSAKQQSSSIHDLDLTSSEGRVHD